MHHEIINYQGKENADPECSDISTSHNMDAIREMSILPNQADDITKDEEQTGDEDGYYIVFTESTSAFDGTYISSVTKIREKPENRKKLEDLLIEFAEDDGCGELDWTSDDGKFGKGFFPFVSGEQKRMRFCRS